MARGVGLWLLLALVPVHAQMPATASAVRVLDDFESTAAWKAVASDGVSAHLRRADGVQGKALCLDYDFNGFSGYAVARRELPMRYPANYEYALQLRGDAPVNNLEFKLGDASGDNVWWVNKPNHPIPREWTPIRLKKRHFAFAWGPIADKMLRATETFEITISAGREGGKGSVCFDDLGFRELPADDVPAPALRATAPVADEGFAADNSVDGRIETAWQASRAARPVLTVDMGVAREFGGVVLRWREGGHASRYRIALSDDGRDWREVRAVTVGNGGDDPIALPESEARYLQLELEAGPAPTYALSELTIEPLAFAATPNDFVKAIAKQSRRGLYPRGFIDEQPYWTIVGIARPWWRAGSVAGSVAAQHLRALLEGIRRTP